MGTHARPELEPKRSQARWVGLRNLAAASVVGSGIGLGTALLADWLGVF